MDKNILENIGRTTETISHANDGIINIIMKELNSLKDRINKGGELSGATSLLLSINEKLKKIKSSSEKDLVLNQQNKKTILNEVNDINTFFNDYLNPKIKEGSHQIDIIKFVE
jgi:hypothetical protein